MPRVHPLPAGPAGDRRQAGDPLVSGPAAGPDRSRAPDRRCPVPRGQGDDRHAGELPRPLRRRPREGRGAGPPGRRCLRVRVVVPGHGPDLPEEAGLAGRLGPGRPGRECSSVRERPAAARPREGAGGAVRVEPDWLLGDGVQAEPDASGADVLDRPIPDGPAGRRQPNRRNPVARTNFGRFGRASDGPAAVVPGGRCPAVALPERRAGAGRPAQGDRPERRAGAAVHGDRGRLDDRRPRRGRPAGAS